jgi:hypothetical protein
MSNFSFFFFYLLPFMVDAHGFRSRIPLTDAEIPTDEMSHTDKHSRHAWGYSQ